MTYNTVKHFKKILSLILFASTFFSLQAAQEIKPKIPWERLKVYNHTLTESEFRRALKTLYSPDGSLYAYLKITPYYVDIFRNTQKTRPALFRLLLAKKHPLKKMVSQHLKKIKSSLPLNELRILLDPGHIGGDYAKMEERVLPVEKHPPIKEAELNLKTALLLKKKLVNLGAKVYLTKKDFTPVTKARPKDFRKIVEKEILSNPSSAKDPSTQKILIQKRMEQLFYRTAEIKARAELAQRIHPDFTLCIHFNAAPASPEKPWVEDNRLVVFVHGCYESQELASEEMRYKLFLKLLENSRETEEKLGGAIATSLAKETSLPAVQYTPSSQYKCINDNPYLYARNLAANRLFPGPVIYLEPYYQNNPLVRDRILEGDYEGKKMIQGKPYKSIFQEYADGVAQGILAWISH
ncbi:MAG: N-acetylmuramoyl-L-alanine amidase [Chlamydiae bacterium]|nr:N-acetylmuramoyl-L-alanine amidase [Chlamydiota bacterium]MBI3277396.1 N-acetylmuramoyl-L-alanine amidase [Chlamydiota bacterium]